MTCFPRRGPARFQEGEPRKMSARVTGPYPLVAFYALHAQRVRAAEIVATNANLLTARILDSMV